MTCFSCSAFILRCGTWNITLYHHFSPSGSLSPLLTPSFLSYHHNLVSSPFSIPLLSSPFLSSDSPHLLPFLPQPLSSSTGCLGLFQSPTLLSSIWQPQNGNKRERRRLRERDKTAKSQVKSYFQPCCFLPLYFLTLLSSLLLNVWKSFYSTNSLRAHE